MFPILTDRRDILNLTAEELEFVPKIVLLRNFEKYVQLLWDRLPEHIKADPEVRSYRACLEHYNRPWQRTHIDGPPPLIKDCHECNRLRQEEKNPPTTATECATRTAPVYSIER
jgi:hypothetical protein